MNETKNTVGPDSYVLETLRGEISEPKTTFSNQPATRGKKVTVRTVLEGVGMAGLKDRDDNKEWSGIFNHIITTARVATYLSQKLARSGVNVDPQLVLDAVLVSHAGRRQWDEACWYPDIASDADQKQETGNQSLSVSILKDADIPEKIVDVVKAHDIPKYPLDKVDAWEKKVALYADFRVAQNLMSLSQRFEDFKKLVADGRWSEEQRKQIEIWGYGIEREIFSKLSIRPEDLTDNNPPKPHWENYIRRLYIQDAEEGIFKRISEIKNNPFDNKIKEELDVEFPPSTWWGRYVRDLYEEKKGKALKHTRKPEGIARAIQFYKWLEEVDLEGAVKHLPKRKIQ